MDMGGSRAEKVLLWERRGKWSQRTNTSFRALGCHLPSGCSPLTPEWGDGSCSSEEGAPGRYQHPGLGCLSPRRPSPAPTKLWVLKHASWSVTQFPYL